MDADENHNVCYICGKRLSRKQRLDSHLRSQHNVEADVPSKRYKLYKDDPNIPIPRTTLYRQRTSQTTASATNDSCENASTSVFNTTEYPLEGLEEIGDKNSSTCDIQDDDDKSVSFENEGAMETIQAKKASENDTFQNIDTNIELATPIKGNTDLLSCGLPDDLSESIQFSDSGSSSSSADNDYTSESDYSDEETINSTAENQNNPVLSHHEEKNMTFLAYANRHCLNREAVNHLMELFAIHNPAERENATTLQMMNTVGETNAELYDFCSKCFSLFPDDDNVFHCVLPTCTGLRYKGTVTQQGLK